MKRKKNTIFEFSDPAPALPKGVGDLRKVPRVYYNQIYQ